MQVWLAYVSTQTTTTSTKRVTAHKTDTVTPKRSLKAFPKHTYIIYRCYLHYHGSIISTTSCSSFNSQVNRFNSTVKSISQTHTLFTVVIYITTATIILTIYCSFSPGVLNRGYPYPSGVCVPNAGGMGLKSLNINIYLIY